MIFLQLIKKTDLLIIRIRLLIMNNLNLKLTQPIINIIGSYNIVVNDHNRQNWYNQLKYTICLLETRLNNNICYNMLMNEMYLNLKNTTIIKCGILWDFVKV